MNSSHMTKVTEKAKSARQRWLSGGKVNLIEVIEEPRDAATQVPPDSIHWRREFYIPLSHIEMRQRLAEDERLFGEEKPQFLHLCKILAATLHYEYQERVEQLKAEYEPFDPDATPKPTEKPADPVERDRCVATLFDKMTDLLRRANYHKLSQSQIEQAVAAASDWGVKLKVDFRVFERLEVYARGDLVGRRTRHRWRNYFRPEEVDVPIYQRLLVIFQLRQKPKAEKHLDTNAVYIKLFKNIPKEDVDMMLPGVKARMSLVDSGKTLSDFALAIYKVALGVVALAAVWKAAGFIGLAIFVAGIVAFAVRSVFGYLNTQKKYELSLTRSLYFQNLDNSSGVLLRLTDEAEQQDFHEVILAYFMLWKAAPIGGLSVEEIDRAAEEYLFRVCGCGIDFDVDDAIQKLQRLNMATVSADGRWQPVPLGDALAALDRAWDNYFNS